MAENTCPSTWATLFKTFQRLHQSMEDEVKAQGLPSLEIYDVLWTLEQAECHALRLSELGEKVFIARFNVTRICDKLEEQGLIEKVKCPSDKRGVHAHLTQAGLELRKKTWDVYGKLIEERFSLKLTHEDHQDLIRILSKLEVNT
jgi:DNA-binding MarR family transcriptional regulator